MLWRIVQGRVGDKCRVTLGEAGGARQPTCSQIWWNSVMQSLASEVGQEEKQKLSDV